MAVSFYAPTGIPHTTSVDFSKRSISQPVHIVQYDRTLPILAVNLYNNGQLFRLPEDADINIRFGKPDKTFVYNKTLGCNDTRTIVYFAITEQMTIFNGDFYPVIEMIMGDSIANSSSICISIDKNPIQNDYIESSNEYKALIDYRNEALDARDKAIEASNNAKQSEENARIYKEAAGVYAQNASQFAQNAEQSAQNAEQSAQNASQFAQNAEQSAQNAKQSEDDTLLHVEMSKSYAVGTDNMIRENDSIDNSKYYSELAKEETKKCKDQVSIMEDYLSIVTKKLNTVEFEVDYATGELIQTSNTSYVFSINQSTGNLEWEVVS